MRKKTIMNKFYFSKNEPETFLRSTEKKQFFINLFIEVGVPSLSLMLPLHVNHFLLRNKIIIYDIIHGSKSVCERGRKRENGGT